MNKSQKVSKIKYTNIRITSFLGGVLFLVFTSLVLPSFSKWKKHPKEIAAKHYVIADRAYEKGRIKKAIRHLKKALDLDKYNGNYINRMAQIYHEQKKYRQALNYLSKMRLHIQDFEPAQAVQLLNWEGCYSLAYDMRKEAIQRFEDAIHMMDRHAIVDSLLKASIYCNWGVAELYDQGLSEPCDTTLIGECYKIHITDVRRAARYFKQALAYNPDECYKPGRWNYALTQKLLRTSQKTLTKHYGYLPKSSLYEIEISHEDTFCTLTAQRDSLEKIAGVMNLEAFKDIPKYKEVLFVMDISGSMNAQISKRTETSRFDLMVSLIEQEIEQADSSQRIGMLTIGGDCPEVPSIRMPVDTQNRSDLINTLYSLQPYGGTPIYNTLKNSPYCFSLESNEKIILLASDGLESCYIQESVCELASKLCEQGIKIEVFSLLLDERSNYDAYGLYQCMSDACKTSFTAITEEGKIEDKVILAPIDNYSMTINREDLLTSVYKVEY